jgi:hypothetical protein
MKIIKAYSLDLTRHMAQFYITIATTRLIADTSWKIGLKYVEVEWLYFL